MILLTSNFKSNRKKSKQQETHCVRISTVVTLRVGLEAVGGAEGRVRPLRL